jgi:hypothetical protein
LRLGALGLALVLGACSNDGPSSTGVVQGVDAIIFLQRTPRIGNGNVFDYLSYEPGARLVKLEPASTDGKLTVLTSDPMFAGADIMSWDLSFDAKSVVFSARLQGEGNYQLFTMNVDGTNVRQVTGGEFEYVYPIYLPGQRLMFTTNKNVEAEAPQFQDEYERQETAQVGTINLDGTDEQLGARNVSHRVTPALMPDGNVIYTEWRHLGEVNDGHLRMMNTDMTRMREAFGGEEGAEGGTNSYLKARYVSTASDGTFRVVAVATSRDRTLQSGKLFLLNLGRSEAQSDIIDLTPAVPGGDAPSTTGVGRYYDAEPMGDPAANQFIVSWADGPVESEILALASTPPNFGLYVYDARTRTRRPLYDDLKYWDVLARPLKARAEPPVTLSTVRGEDFVVNAINVYSSSLTAIPAGTATKVRLMEGFSGEEGIRTFGTTEFDGQSRYGEVPVATDGSFSARVPANVPVHMQVVDKFAVSIADEPIWISGRSGEQRTCGGCHESRTASTDLTPGQLEAVLRGAVNLVVPRAQRVSLDFSYDNIKGVPWDLALQPVFDAKCASCHDGDATKPGNKSFTVTDMTSMTEQTFVFDLRGQKLNVMVGERMTGLFSASYISVMGLGEIIGENMVTITGTQPCTGVTPGLDGEHDTCAEPANAAGSPIIARLNPPQRFTRDAAGNVITSINTSVRRYTAGVHPADVGGQELTPDEYYRLILNIDMGGQFFFRENKDGAQEPLMGGN